MDSAVLYFPLMTWKFRLWPISADQTGSAPVRREEALRVEGAITSRMCQRESGRVPTADIDGCATRMRFNMNGDLGASPNGNGATFFFAPVLRLVAARRGSLLLSVTGGWSPPRCMTGIRRVYSLGNISQIKWSARLLVSDRVLQANKKGSVLQQRAASAPTEHQQTPWRNTCYCPSVGGKKNTHSVAWWWYYCCYK